MFKTNKIAFNALNKLTINKRIEALRDRQMGASLLGALTPTEFAALLPKYYQRELPDIGGFRRAVSMTTSEKQAQMNDQLMMESAAKLDKVVGDTWNKIKKVFTGEQTGTIEKPTKNLTPLEKAIVETTGMDISGGSSESATLKGDPLKVFNVLKEGGKIDMSNLDDAQANIIRRMSPQDFAKSGLKLSEQDGKTFVTAAPIEVSKEEIKQEMEQGGSLKQQIDTAAKKYNIDPRMMYGIVAGESAHGAGYDKKVDNIEESYGPFQLNKRGGLGADFQKQTGLDPANPKTLPQQTEWVAKQLKEHPEWITSNDINVKKWYGYHGNKDWDPSWGKMGVTGGAQSAEEAQKIIEERKYTERGQTFAGGTIETPSGLSGKAKEEFDKMNPGEKQRFSDAWYKMGGGEEANKKINESISKGNDITTIISSQTVVEKQQQVAGVRTLPIKQELKTFLSYAAEKTGVGFEITSGGQTADKKTGSNRHNVDIPGTIGAADGRLYVMEDGKKRYLRIDNDSDIPLIKKFTKEFASVAPSAGVGTNYMAVGTPSQKELFHFGGGNFKGDKPIAYDFSAATPSPDWFKEAHAEGVKKFGSKETLSEFNKWHDQKLAQSENKSSVKSITQDSVVDAAPEEQKKVKEDMYRSKTNPFGGITAAEAAEKAQTKQVTPPTAPPSTQAQSSEAPTTAPSAAPQEQKKEQPKAEPAKPKSFNLNRTGLVEAIKQTSEYKKETANIPSFLISDDAILDGFFKDKQVIKKMKDTGTVYDSSTGKVTSKDPEKLLKSFGDMDTSNVLIPISDQRSAVEPTTQTAAVTPKSGSLMDFFGVSTAQAGEMTPQIAQNIAEERVRREATTTPTTAPTPTTPSAPAASTTPTSAPTPTTPVSTPSSGATPKTTTTAASVTPTSSATPVTPPAPQAGKPDEKSTQDFLKSQGVGQKEPEKVPAKAEGGPVDTGKSGEVSAYPIGGLRGDNSVVVDTQTQQPLFTMNTKTEAMVPTGESGRANVVPTNKTQDSQLQPQSSVTDELNNLRSEFMNALSSAGNNSQTNEIKKVSDRPDDDKGLLSAIGNLTGRTPYSDGGFTPSFSRAMSRSVGLQESGGGFNQHFSAIK